MKNDKWKMENALMIVAGEASGDRHGANLVKALRLLKPDTNFEFFGSGGDEMRSAGVETVVDSRELAIMGVFEVARALPKFMAVFRRLRKAARVRKPALVILIDWPEFNLRLAKKLRRDGHRVVYYISPQIWAWRSYRINTIRRNVEKILVILPFEQEYYERHGVRVDYVGHPLLDSVHITKTRENFCSELNLDPNRPIVSLLPGSRHSEVNFILPPLIESARLIARRRSDVQFIMPIAGTFSPAQIRSEFGDLGVVNLIENDTHNALAASDLAVVASGTATLETSIIGTPMIIVYRASSLNWRIFRPMINVLFVGMPNLIAGREVAPELLQDDLNPVRLSAQVIAMLDDPDDLSRRRELLKDVREKLGESNASERAAAKILEMLEPA